jgi:CBS domain-containing protein
VKVRHGIRRSAVAVRPDATIRDIAGVMERAGVGAVVVIDGDRPVGVITDRDLVRRALATGLASDARADAVMSSPVVSISAEDDLHAAFALLRSNTVRRLAVLDGQRFIGMLSIDDLLVDLAADLADLARPVSAELHRPHRDASVPAKI